MNIKHFPSSATDGDVAEALRQDGVAVVDRVASGAVMDAIAEELRPWTDKTPYGPDDFSGHRTRCTGALIARSPKCRDLI